MARASTTFRERSYIFFSKHIHFFHTALGTLPFLFYSGSIRAFSQIDEKRESISFIEESLSTDNASTNILAIAVRDVENAAEYINMLKWKDTPEDLPQPKELYNRKLHFGRWINDPNDDTCFNTRAKVLVRDAKGDIEFREKNKCVVEHGEWHDPYTDHILRSARDLQIDHLVPLKNAYISGAWNWDFQLRCLYANYMNENYHLIAVDGIQNMAKGDRGPDAYLPPNEKFTCEYLHHWLAVKLVWKLQMSQAEANGVKTALREAGCQESDYRYSVANLRDQRKFITQNLQICQSITSKKNPNTPP